MKSKNPKYPPSRLRGLKPCKPGETHNPSGRPKDAYYFKKTMFELFDKIDIEKWVIANKSRFVEMLSRMTPKELEISGREDGAPIRIQNESEYRFKIMERMRKIKHSGRNTNTDKQSK